MDETRDSRLAEILARGMSRVRHRAGRPDQILRRGDDKSHSTAAKLPGDVHQPAEQAADDDQGEQK
jgi:hypothetical protein